MEIDEIDYEELEENLKNNPAAIGLGELCIPCSMATRVHNTNAVVKAQGYFTFFHPKGRLCGTT